MELGDDSKTVPEVTKVKGYRIIAMDGFIANWYNKMVQKLPEVYKTWATMVAENVADGSRILDAAPGPGYLSIELAKRGKYTIVGLDISKTFVEIEQKNAAEAGVGAAVEFRQGDVAHMPFDDEMFDFIISTASFRLFADPIGALREMYRVLKENGKAVIIDMRRDASDAEIRDSAKSLGLGRRDSLRMKWLFNLLRRQAYSKNQLESFISQTNFRRYNIRGSNYVIAFEMWLEK